MMPKVQTLREAYGLCRAFGESHGEELARSSARISRARAPHIKIDQNRRLHEAGKLRNVKTGGPVLVNRILIFCVFPQRSGRLYCGDLDRWSS